MPTEKPRHIITETQDISQAIDIASQYWPGHTRSQLLKKLIHAGKERISEEKNLRYERLTRIKNSLPGVFPPYYLEELHEEWPK